MGSIDKWCMMCGAAPGEPCKVISGGEGLHPGDVRPDVHFSRNSDSKPNILIPDEPDYVGGK